YAGCPAESKGKAHRISADKARGARLLPIAFLAIEESEAENAQEMQAHQDDEDAGELGEKRQMRTDELPSSRGGGAEEHEDGGKTEHEGKGSRHRAVARNRGIISQIVERGASDEAQIRRHQRQDARAEEAQEAAKECRQKSNRHRNLAS